MKLTLLLSTYVFFRCLLFVSTPRSTRISRPEDMAAHAALGVALPNERAAPAPFRRALLNVFDALRWDWLAPSAWTRAHGPLPSAGDLGPAHNRFRFVYNLTAARPANARILKALCEAPTMTLQRIEAIMGGLVPDLFDATMTLSGSSFPGDHLLNHVDGAYAVGDHTWEQLFSGAFRFHESGDSLAVNDIDATDRVVHKHLWPHLLEGSLGRSQWQVYITHWLGGDSIGHEYTMFHPFAAYRYELYDRVVSNLVHVLSGCRLGRDFFSRELGPACVPSEWNLTKPLTPWSNGMLQALRDRDGDQPYSAIYPPHRVFESGMNYYNDTILMVFGDHGAREFGGHGGDTKEELEAGFFVYSPLLLPEVTEVFEARVIAPGSTTSEFWDRELKQGDLAVTLAALMGLTIPANSGGIPVLQVIPAFPFQTELAQPVDCASGIIVKNPMAGELDCHLMNESGLSALRRLTHLRYVGLWHVRTVRIALRALEDIDASYYKLKLDAEPFRQVASSCSKAVEEGRWFDAVETAVLAGDDDAVRAALKDMLEEYGGLRLVQMAKALDANWQECLYTTRVFMRDQVDEITTHAHKIRKPLLAFYGSVLPLLLVFVGHTCKYVLDHVLNPAEQPKRSRSWRLASVALALGFLGMWNVKWAVAATWLSAVRDLMPVARQLELLKFFGIGHLRKAVVDFTLFIAVLITYVGLQMSQPLAVLYLNEMVFWLTMGFIVALQAKHVLSTRRMSASLMYIGALVGAMKLNDLFGLPQLEASVFTIVLLFISVLWFRIVDKAQTKECRAQQRVAKILGRLNCGSYVLLGLLVAIYLQSADLASRSVSRNGVLQSLAHVTLLENASALSNEDVVKFAIPRICLVLLLGSLAVNKYAAVTYNHSPYYVMPYLWWVPVMLCPDSCRNSACLCALFCLVVLDTRVRRREYATTGEETVLMMLVAMNIYFSTGMRCNLTDMPLKAGLVGLQYSSLVVSPVLVFLASGWPFATVGALAPDGAVLLEAAGAWYVWNGAWHVWVQTVHTTRLSQVVLNSYCAKALYDYFIFGAWALGRLAAFSTRRRRVQKVT